MSERDIDPKLRVPAVKRPKLPQIRPEVKEGIDKMIEGTLPHITPEETQYLVSKLKDAIAKRAKSMPKSPNPQATQTSQMPTEIKPASPIWRRILDDLEMVEKEYTKDYEIRPEMILPPIGNPHASGYSQFKELAELIGLPKIKDRIVKILDSEKVQNALADHVIPKLGKLIDAWVKKIEEETGKI